MTTDRFTHMVSRGVVSDELGHIHGWQDCCERWCVMVVYSEQVEGRFFVNAEDVIEHVLRNCFSFLGA